MSSLGQNCYIICSECKGKRVTIDKPRIYYDLVITMNEWLNNPALECSCGMRRKCFKTVDVKVNNKILPEIREVFNKGLKLVAVD